MKILERSLEIARAAYPSTYKEKKESLHWSFIWKKGKLLSLSTNDKRTHPLNSYNSKYIEKGRCSEFNGFIKLRYISPDGPQWHLCTLVNVRIDRERRVCNSRLCPACQNLVQYLGIKRIYYSTNEGNFEKYL